MLGEQLTAHDALRMGLVNRVVPVSDLQSEAESMAHKVASLPMEAVRRNKLLVNRVYQLAGFQEALAYRDDPIIAAALESADSDQVADERRRMISETGWGAFRDNRDAEYQK